MAYQRAGGDKRGNSKDRARRKIKMLADAKWHGDATTVPCVHCKITLTYDTVEADRIVPGGPYAYWNVQPACRDCNLDRSNKIDWVGPVAMATA